MPRPTLTVVISAGQSRNPEKRQLEQGVAEGAAMLENVGVLQVPHLYDLPPHSETYRQLRLIPTDLVVVSWLFARAAHWVLDRNGVRGQVGDTELRYGEEDEELSEPEPSGDDDGAVPRVLDGLQLPSRRIFSLDFRASTQVADFLAEIERIRSLVEADQAAGSASSDNHAVTPTPPADAESSRAPLTFDLLARMANPTNDTYVGSPANQADQEFTLFGETSKVVIDEHPGRRWYPVIDYSRCTNCMECIDFCLFGVYGIDGQETIKVEQADNCRKGCPACSRVCPENAIIFPQHKTPAIAGAPVTHDGLKIDLSKLFGAPETDEDPIAVAARERDEQLLLAGRQAVGMTVGIRERIQQKKQDGQQGGHADQLDDLLDQLDSLDL
ncbi:MAG: Fe-S oxidoreductase [Pirellulaceae bacterium]|nr:MAG: Fe-S oxidoreductase [Pirellulaceae bacterium]